MVIYNSELDESYTVIKYDLNGDIIWQKDPGYNNCINIIQTHNQSGKVEGYILVGNGYPNIDTKSSPRYYDAIIVKLDLDGNIIWQKNYGGSSGDEFFSVVESYNEAGYIDGYVAVGVTRSNDIAGITNKGESDAIIVKYDLNGNVIWQKNYGYEYYDNFNSITKSYDSTGKTDGYIVAGDIYNFESHELYKIIKYNLNGDIVWQKNYENENDGDFYSIVESYNEKEVIDGYVVVGHIYSEEDDDNYSYTDAIIVKYDLNGNVVYEDTYGTKGDDYFSQVIHHYDESGKADGFIAVGSYACNDYTSGEGDTSTRSLLSDYKVSKLSKSNIDKCYGEYDGLLVSYTYPKKNIEVDEVSSSNGKVEISSNAVIGSIVTVNVTPDFGYEVDKIIVTDANGNEIEVIDNRFVMPDTDVKIKVIYRRITNPQTSNFWYTILGITFILLLGTYLTYKVKEVNS